MTDIPNLPATASENGKQGITGCYVSAPDDNKLMVITGYGYANVEGFDGAVEALGLKPAAEKGDAAVDFGDVGGDGLDADQVAEEFCRVKHGEVMGWGWGMETEKEFTPLGAARQA